MGSLAAAGLYALKNNISRLNEDHDKAKIFADKLSKIPGLVVSKELVQTNIIMLSPLKISADQFLSKAKDLGLLLGTGRVGVIRAVTHMDVSFEEIDQAIEIIEKIIS